MTPPRRSPLAGLLVAAILTAAAAPAAARTLTWEEMAVEARLDGEGRLHARERHVLVFDGDWNGGERAFRLELGHDLDVVRFHRETPQGPRELEEGDLDAVDEYGWGEGKIDEAWLAEHVFSHPPEVVGAAWDETTGAGAA